MRSTALSLLALVACSNGSPATASSPDQPPPASPGAPRAPEHWLGLDSGRYTAIPLVLSIPAELGDVQARFARATATHQAWLQQYLEELQLPPGAPLPYHPNFAISEAEYRDLLDAYERPVLVEGERRDLDVRVEGDALRFSAPAPLAALDPLAIEASGRVRHDDAVTDRPERVEGLRAKFGVWSGFAWRRDASNAADGRIDVLELELGRVADRRFLRLSRRRSGGAATTEPVELLLWIESPRIDEERSSAAR